MKTVAEMTHQEILDKVAMNLAIQGEVSFMLNRDGETKTCAYRGVGSLTCSVGGLMPDSLYDPIMEGESVCDIYGYPEVEEFFGEHNQDLLTCIQDIHDGEYGQPKENFWNNVKREFKYLAQKEGLNLYGIQAADAKHFEIHGVV